MSEDERGAEIQRPRPVPRALGSAKKACSLGVRVPRDLKEAQAVWERGADGSGYELGSPVASCGGP
jgi:hypothetical protein